VLLHLTQVNLCRLHLLPGLCHLGLVLLQPLLVLTLPVVVALTLGLQAQTARRRGRYTSGCEGFNLVGLCEFVWICVGLCRRAVHCAVYGMLMAVSRAI
jgi:hypothetical protein